MPYFTYDTSVIIAIKLSDFHKMPQRFLMSAVVLMELIGGAKDPAERKIHERMFLQYQKNKLLIVPTDDDWLIAAKILFLLAHARKHSKKGKLQRLAPGVSRRMALDVLIAVSARRWKAQVVTENWTDFKAIQRYCNTTIIKAANFFRK